MRKDYEQRLEDLAESKRQALREMNNQFEDRLEEKDVILLEVKAKSILNTKTAMHINRYNWVWWCIEYFYCLQLQEQLDLEKREHETIKTSIEDDADREIVEIKASYEMQLKEEKDANVRLKGETGLMKKKLITAHKEIDELKHQVLQLKGTYVANI